MKLLLLPGHMCDAAVWAPVAAGIADLASCVTGDVGRHDSIEAIADALLAENSGRLAVAGFSFGGFVALQMAAGAPERVSGLALIGTVPLPFPIEQRAERLRRLAVAEADGTDAYIQTVLPHYLHASDAGVADVIAAMARRIGMDALRRQVRANFARPDARPILPALRMPTMVLCGVADAICVRQDHRAMAEAIPSAVFTEVAQAGHFVTLEQPAAVVAAMRSWLERVRAEDQH